MTTKRLFESLRTAHNIRKAGGTLALAAAAIVGTAFLEGCGEGPVRDIPPVSRTLPSITDGPCPSLSGMCDLDPLPLTLDPQLNLDSLSGPLEPDLPPDVLP
jgi:hypothetical protein